MPRRYARRSSTRIIRPGRHLWGNRRPTRVQAATAFANYLRRLRAYRNQIAQRSRSRLSR